MVFGKKKILCENPIDRHGRSIFRNELAADPTGYGFAFGGVEPGRLRAKGLLVETHRVGYSIAKVGRYLLHVVLRHDSVELPGSPFELRVTAGPASPTSTKLPAQALPLHGVVGSDVGCGCHVLMQAADRMGNPCEAGGAKVKLFCEDGSVTCGVEDLRDGSYRLTWRSSCSGTFDTSLTIDDQNIQGSPTTVKLVAERPDWSQTLVSGPGLAAATAGKSTHFQIACRDKYGNSCRAPSSVCFELSLMAAVEPTAGSKGAKTDSKKKEKEQVTARMEAATPLPHEGGWVDINGGSDLDKAATCLGKVSDVNKLYEVCYVADIAGDLELHLWLTDTDTDTDGGHGGKREALPGSPFAVSSTAGRAHAAGSSVVGFTRVDGSHERQLARSRGADAHKRSDEAAAAHDPRRLRASCAARPLEIAARQLETPEKTHDTTYDTPHDTTYGWVYAGDMVSVSPKICDKLGNDTAAPTGALVVSVDTAQGEEGTHLEPTVSVRGGLTRYEVRYAPTAQGIYLMHVHLAGTPIAGSPVGFECIPGLPSVSKSTLEMPHQEGIPETVLRDHSSDHTVVFCGTSYEIIVRAYDVIGNALDRGGAHVVAKITSIGGVQPSKKGDNDFEVVDRGDGTYLLTYLLTD